MSQQSTKRIRGLKRTHVEVKVALDIEFKEGTKELFAEDFVELRRLREALHAASITANKGIVRIDEMLALEDIPDFTIPADIEQEKFGLEIVEAGFRCIGYKAPDGKPGYNCERCGATWIAHQRGR